MKNKYLVFNNYTNYFRKFFYSPLVSRLENLLLETFFKKTIHTKHDHNPIFILGIPRSGTTIVYQCITYFYSCLYIDNFVERFSSTPSLAFHLRNIFFRSRKHNSFKSNYGDTSNDGWLAPNQGVNFWYHWMPDTCHYHHLDDLSLQKRRNIRNTISYLINRFDRPIVFKELSLSQKLPIIKDVLPESKFIIVERDPIDVSISIYRAMLSHNIPQGTMWGAFFRGYEGFLHLETREMIAHQVTYLNYYMEQGLMLFDEKNIHRLRYRDFVSDPHAVIPKISTFLGVQHDLEIDELILNQMSVYPSSLRDEFQNLISKARNHLQKHINLS